MPRLPTRVLEAFFAACCSSIRYIQHEYDRDYRECSLAQTFARRSGRHVNYKPPVPTQNVRCVAHRPPNVEQPGVSTRYALPHRHYQQTAARMVLPRGANGAGPRQGSLCLRSGLRECTGPLSPKIGVLVAVLVTRSG